MWKIVIYDMQKFMNNDYDSMELVKEVSEQPDTDSLLRIDEKIYRWCALSPKNKIFCVKEIEINDNPEENLYNSNFQCPYCDAIDFDAWELSEDSRITKCHHCNSEIEYEKNIEVTYNVYPVKQNTIINY